MPSPPEPPAAPAIQLRRDLIAQGWTDRALAAAVRSGQLVRVRRGAYVDARAWMTLDGAQRYAARCRAVQLQACCELVLSHVSALPAYGAPLWGLSLDVVHGSRSDERAGRREAGVVQHRGLLLPEDVEVHDGVRVTSPTRTVLDLSTLVDVEPALVVANDLAHRGLVSSAGLRARYERPDGDGGMQHWPGTLATRIVLDLMDPAIESVGESRVAYLCFSQSLPRPETQVKVRDENGRVVARVDFAWPALGVFLEFDGRVKYGADGQTVWEEKRREDRIRELTGWRCIRLTWADLDDPVRTAARIRAVLAAAVERAS